MTININIHKRKLGFLLEQGIDLCVEFPRESFAPPRRVVTSGTIPMGIGALTQEARRLPVVAMPARPADMDKLVNQLGERDSRVLEREALGPPRRAGEFIEERDAISAFRRLAHHLVDLKSVRPDEDAPAIGLDAVEDDRRGLCRAGQCLLAKTPLELGHEV